MCSIVFLNRRSSQEMSEVKDKIRRLERDLDNAMEVSNRCISDR